MDFARFRGQSAWRPVAACAALKTPAAADWIPLILRFQILEAWIWRPGAWMPGCWQDWRGLEEVTEVMAGWEEGIGRNCHTLELQELGGLGTSVGQSPTGQNLTYKIMKSRYLCKVHIEG